MPRPPRFDSANEYYHIYNRKNGLGAMFEDSSSYREFVHEVGEAAEHTGMRILAYCVMPNHWHMLVRPRIDGDLGRFVHRLSQRHSHRWNIRHGTVGRGGLYQGRYGSCIIRNDQHLLTVCRYIERNPVRANLVSSAVQWPWSSAPYRASILGVSAESVTGPRVVLEDFPVEFPRDWIRWINEPQTAAELDRLRNHIRRGTPYGDAEWRRKLEAGAAL